MNIDNLYEENLKKMIPRSLRKAHTIEETENSKERPSV